MTPTQYENDEEVANIGMVDDYEKIKDMKMDDLNKYMKKKNGEKYRKDAENHPAVKQKKIKRMVKNIEANENDDVYDLSNLYGGKRKKKVNKK
jgi:hypothetical protein